MSGTSRLQRLQARYEEFVRLPWTDGLSGREKVWFCLYEPADERRLRQRVPLFELATTGAGHGWRLVDLQGGFERWLRDDEYRDTYFADPTLLPPALDLFHEHLVEQVAAALQDAPEGSVVALAGAGSLFGVGSVSRLVEDVTGAITASRRLMVFFPGVRDGSNYRLLDARDGWTYLAVPIEA